MTYKLLWIPCLLLAPLSFAQQPQTRPALPDAKLFSPPEGSRIVDLRNPPESQSSKPEN